MNQTLDNKITEIKTICSTTFAHDVNAKHVITLINECKAETNKDKSALLHSIHEYLQRKAIEEGVSKLVFKTIDPIAMSKADGRKYALVGRQDRELLFGGTYDTLTEARNGIVNIVVDTYTPWWESRDPEEYDGITLEDYIEKRFTSEWSFFDSDEDGMEWSIITYCE